MTKHIMLFAIDIGNTSTVLGIFDKANLKTEWRFTSKLMSEEDIWHQVEAFCTMNRIETETISGVVIASVVPDQTLNFVRMAKRFLNTKAVVVSGELSVGMPLQYHEPKTLGADRICNAVAAYEKFGGPTIIVDLGMATNYDVISKKGEFLGGVIAPGVETSAAGLYRRTAQLPNIDLRFPGSVIRTDTRSAMQAGILYGAVDALEGMVRRIKEITGKKTKVIATGGYSALIAKHTDQIDHLEPSLVLEGARLIYARVIGKM